MVNKSVHSTFCIRYCDLGNEVKFEIFETGKRHLGTQPEGSHWKEKGSCLRLHVLHVTVSMGSAYSSFASVGVLGGRFGALGQAGKTFSFPSQKVWQTVC